MLEISCVINNEIFLHCSNCGRSIGSENELPEDWEFCPYCGKAFDEE